MTFRVVRTNQYNQDLGLIHSTNGNHLESPNEGSSIDHQVTIYLHAQNITMFPTNETRTQHKFYLASYAGTTNKSKAQNNEECSPTSSKELKTESAQRNKQFTNTQKLHASTPALIQGLKWVANERAKLGESSATKIVKKRGWNRWESAVESYGEQ
ncbi:UDP-glucose:glycoprotein glucosyltransferase-like [Dorcoceras hygrometricum]|uniref:UDP-glucose:glycoprotein glucosyltransferase-like n=1 Tax=Dorcoceras hygrometricum TaxID=472368 RepID=A0A2Z7BVL7_9LAMI|nr:UDP-glucose:glycoprotein glucosyltransferase-like [Dorcoceras hygrometricum]